jgi:hypothetical protein
MRPPVAEPSFLAGYRRWLAQHRWWIASILLAALAVFAGALWLTSTPQDAFAYEFF